MKNYVLIICLLLFGGQSAKLHAHGEEHLNKKIQFVPNEGQWKDPFRYQGRIKGADLYLENNGITFVTGAKENPSLIEQHKLGFEKDPILKFHAYQFTWTNGNSFPKIIPLQKRPEYHNYYLGKDKSKWKSNVGVYEGLLYENVYSNIDFHIYEEKELAKYDFIVKPGGNPDFIKTKYKGVDDLTLKEGYLYIKTSVGTIIEMKPYAYQDIDGKRVTVACNYKLDDNKTISYDLPNSYNNKHTLVIDPTMSFASLTGSIADNWGFTATYDNNGNLYAGGIVMGVGYPTTLGAFQTNYGGGVVGGNFGMDCDISISKFSATGTNLIYSTYIGGSGNEMPHSLVVDNNNNLILSGKSTSINYPTTTNSYDTSHNGNFDLIISKLNATGTAMIGSTYIGGSGNDAVNISANYNVASSLKHNYGDDSRSEVIVDNAGNIYVVSNTNSNNFPVTSGAAKSAITGTQDGVFVKLNPTLSTLLYSTLIGGSSNDGAYSIVLNKNQTDIYISGGTESTDFHTTSLTGSYQNTYNGNIDGFVMHFSNPTTGIPTLINSSYIGTNAYDQCYGVQTDYSGNVYLMGQTMGSFPVSLGTYTNANGRQFIIKLNTSLSTRIFSTIWGQTLGATAPSTSPNISPVAFLVDTCENIYISGWGGLTTSASNTTSTYNMPITNDALQSTTDGSDFYFIALSKNAQNLLYGSYFGAVNKQEHVDGGTSRFDPNGVIYQALCASCGNGSAYPATTGAYATTKGSTNCNVGVVKILFNLGSVDAEANATPSGIGCAPFTVQFNNSSTNATIYNWTFGDGGTSNATNPTHTFTTAGTYNVRLIAQNPNACRTLDTTFIQIIVRSDSVNPIFTHLITDSCVNRTVAVTNQSLPIPNSNVTTYLWDFGDGFTTNAQNPLPHSYASPGTYVISLTMSDTSTCNLTRTVSQTIRFDSTVISATLSNQNVCLGNPITFNANGSNVITYSWDFGDNTTSNLPTPSHTYTAVGNYTVTLIVHNPDICIKSDTLTIIVIVSAQPTVSFDYSPGFARNEPVHFTNQSTGATTYSWNFGDGTLSSLINPIHEFVSSGTYNVCLTARSSEGCPAVVCRKVSVEIIPSADVPTGFSPNGDGENDVLYVRGYGIQELEWTIFNRWGQKVFQTTDKSQGWNGTFNGTIQEIETYGWVLTVKYADGRLIKKQGNVTLLR